MFARLVEFTRDGERGAEICFLFSRRLKILLTASDLVEHVVALLFIRAGIKENFEQKFLY